MIKNDKNVTLKAQLGLESSGPPKTTLNDFKLLVVLGKGAFGKVTVTITIIIQWNTSIVDRQVKCPDYRGDLISMNRGSTVYSIQQPYTKQYNTSSQSIFTIIVLIFLFCDTLTGIPC